jgi:hypothetical protein
MNLQYTTEVKCRVPDAYLTRESKETMNFSELFTAKFDRARSIEKMNMKLKPRQYMI